MDKPLVSGNNPIPDAYMTASTQFSVDTVPHYARINNTLGRGSWRATNTEISAIPPAFYIQVGLRIAFSDLL